jgi:hypothetical protein
MTQQTKSGAREIWIGDEPESWEVRLVRKVLTAASCVSSMGRPYFFTLAKLSSGYTPRLYRMLQPQARHSNQSPNPKHFPYRPHPKQIRASSEMTPLFPSAHLFAA